MEDPQQKSLLQLCAAGIGVYSPHTSLDSAVGGINDWLASIITLKAKAEVSPIVPCAGVEGMQYDRETNYRPRERRTWTGCNTTVRDYVGNIDQPDKNWIKLEIWYYPKVLRY